MRIPVLIVLTGLALGATACATIETPVDPPPVSSAPAPIENHDWFFQTEDGDAGLAYGLDESDDIWLSLSCRQGSGRLELVRPVGADHPLTISVESGGDTETYPATSEPSELHDGVYLTAQAPARDPVFQRFRRTGWMAVLGPDYRGVMVPQPASTPNIERFFAFCG